MFDINIRSSKIAQSNFELSPRYDDSVAARERKLQNTLHNKETNTHIKNTEDVILTIPKRVISSFSGKITYLNPNNLSVLSDYPELIDQFLHINPGDILSFQIRSAEGLENMNDSLIPAIMIKSGSNSSLIKTPFGLISTDIDLHMQQGTKLLLTIVQNAAATALAIPQYPNIPAIAREFFTKYSQNLETLQYLVTSLQMQHDPKDYRKLSAALLARNQTLLSAKILRHTRQVGASEVEKWIDEEILEPITEAKQHNIIKQIEPLLREIRASQNEDDDSTCQWRDIEIPIFNGIWPITCHLFVRGQNKPKHFIRFVTEVALTNINVQLDGLIYFTDHGSCQSHIDHFDLIIRSKSTIDPVFSQEMSSIFLAHQAINGLKGILKFEEVVEFPVNPQDEIR